jgi:hypothetical protein
MTVQVKGGMRRFVADTIYISSPEHPDEWYKDDGSDKLNQLCAPQTKDPRGPQGPARMRGREAPQLGRLHEACNVKPCPVRGVLARH